MNAFLDWLIDHQTRWTETDAMNVLQDAGIISDNCIDASDVPDCDCKAAVAYLGGKMSVALRRRIGELRSSVFNPPRVASPPSLSKSHNSDGL
jgi:hypothetical protein